MELVESIIIVGHLGNPSNPQKPKQQNTMRSKRILESPETEELICLVIPEHP